MARERRNIIKRGIKAEYCSWVNAKDRCYRKTHKQYKDYGGRGITVCKRWLDSFENFFADMGPKPTPVSLARRDEYSLDRIDNARPYEPGNCKWSLRAEQMANRRGSKRITYNGETHTPSYWAKKTGIGGSNIINRIIMGWPLDKVFTQPVVDNKHKLYGYEIIDNKKVKVETGDKPSKES